MPRLKITLAFGLLGFFVSLVLTGIWYYINRHGTSVGFVNAVQNVTFAVSPASIFLITTEHASVTSQCGTILFVALLNSILYSAVGFGIAWLWSNVASG